EPRVEFLHRVDKTSFLRQAPRGHLQLPQQLPAPAARQRAHALAPVLQERPVALRARQTSRRTTARPHNRNGFRCRRPSAHGAPPPHPNTPPPQLQLLQQQRRHRRRRRIIKGQRRRQLGPPPPRQPVAQRNRHQRIQAKLLQR